MNTLSRLECAPICGRESVVSEEADRLERACCAVACAKAGDPPCWQIAPDGWREDRDCYCGEFTALAMAEIVDTRERCAALVHRAGHEGLATEIRLKPQP